MKYEVRLTCRITVDDPLPADIGVRLNGILSDWCDGRYPFCTEQVIRGTNDCLREALYHCTQARLREEYGDECVHTDACTVRARWAFELDNEPIPQVSFSSGFSAEIEGVS